MGYRIEHLKTAKKYHHDLNERVRSWAGGLSIRSSWKSWAHHPISNTRYTFWNHVPHAPRMRHEIASIGTVDHEYRNADAIFLASVCQRCGYHVDKGTFVPDK